MSGDALPVGSAVQLILDALRPVETEKADLTDALGRTLAHDVLAGSDLPPWDNSAMDGYACRTADIASASESAPVRLPVVETIAAGAFASRPLGAREAMRIMTGAPVPEGADTVVRVEDTDAGEKSVTVRSARDANRNVRPRGSDVRAGDTVITGGERIGPAAMAMLAALGHAQVGVHRRPRIAILSSGDELIPAGHSSPSAQRSAVVSANSYSLAAIVNDAGGEAVDLGIVRDDLDAMVAVLKRAHGFDLVVTSGGISVGEFDYTRRAIESAGGDIRFWRVAMRPGYNSAFGTVHGVPWLGVPGNAVSALIAGEVLLRPAVRRLSGSANPLRAVHSVALADGHPGTGPVAAFVRVTLEYHRGTAPIARSAGAQGSGILSSSVRADALVTIPAGSGATAPGALVDALILREP